VLANASVWLAPDGTLRAGSRNRTLSLEEDNHGFCEWVQATGREACLAALAALPKGAHIFGEWLVPHTLKTYRAEAWRRFYVFDVAVPGGDGYRFLPYVDYANACAPTGLDLVHPLGVVNHPTVEKLQAFVGSNTYLIADGAGAGEGVVVKRYNYRNRFGRTVWAKVVRNEFKESNRLAFGPATVDLAPPFEARLADAMPPEIAHKVVAKLRAANDGTFNSRMIPQLLGTVWHDFVTEELWEILKRHKNPTINFAVLQRHVYAAVKRHVPELF